MLANKSTLMFIHTFLAGITAVSVAAHKGRQEIVKMLIAANADVNIDSNNGSTPLIQASHFGRSDTLEPRDE